MKYVKMLIVLISGFVLTEVLKSLSGIKIESNSFGHEFYGVWVGPMLIGWSLSEIWFEEKKP